MQEIVSFLLNILAIHVAFFHFSIQISADSFRSPALSPIPQSESSVPPSKDGTSFDVTKYGAVADGKTDNTKAFLAAWNAACAFAGNPTVYIPKGTFLIGPITFTGPCHNSKSPAMTIQGTLLALPSLKAFPGSEWIVFYNLNRLVLTGGTGVTNFDGQGAVEAWKQGSCQSESQCHVLINSLKLNNVSYGTIDGIVLVNSKSFHINIDNSYQVTIQNSRIAAPGDSPNTDGIHIGRSKNISIISTNIGVGDDCVSIGPGSVNINVSHVTCGPGHGISIGSLGKYQNEEDVVGITVQNSVISGTTNGVRIKTWPGSDQSKASNINFQDIHVSNVGNPIIIDQLYCPAGNCDTSKPSFVKLSEIYVKNINGTYNTDYAVNLECSLRVPCQNINIIGVNLKDTRSIKCGESRLYKKSVVGLQVTNSSFC